jgi:hypothetical protein
MGLIQQVHLGLVYLLKVFPWFLIDRPREMIKRILLIKLVLTERVPNP